MRVHALPRVLACTASVLALALTPAGTAIAAPPPPPTALFTTAEATEFAQTGRHDEVARLCRDFAAAHPGRVRCETFGTTPEGRAMHALIASEDGALDPATARKRGRTVVLAQGGIHAGEIDGKDAGFIALRQVLDGTAAAGVLSKVTFVFVPIFNVDGHERFGLNHRPNQNGPESCGWRTTAQNLNLNRDFVKLDAPETRALVALLDAWDPELFLDLHVTNGAHFQHDVAVMIEPAEAGPEPLRAPALALRQEVLARLSDAGHLPLSFYPSFLVGDDPSSGTTVNAFGPRFAHGYWGWRERLGLLVETHSWKDYRTRVAATRVVILASLEAAARDGASWREAARAAEALAAASGGSDVTLAWKASSRERPIDFLGVAFERKPSEISGGLVTRYRPDSPLTWTIPLRDVLEPAATARAPRAGYVIPAAHVAMIEPLLRLHRVTFETLDATTRIEGEAWRASDVTFPAMPFEGRFQPALKGAWEARVTDVPPGSLYVPVAQPGARLIVQMFDPAGPDSLAQWGFFNASFERKEYMEAYVAETVARDMLRADERLAAEFAQRLASDAAFAASPAARLEFFHRRHPSWDDRVNLVPILRVNAPPGPAGRFEPPERAAPAPRMPR